MQARRDGCPDELVREEVIPGRHQLGESPSAPGASDAWDGARRDGEAGAAHRRPELWGADAGKSADRGQDGPAQVLPCLLRMLPFERQA